MADSIERIAACLIVRLGIGLGEDVRFGSGYRACDRCLLLILNLHLESALFRGEFRLTWSKMCTNHWMSKVTGVGLGVEVTEHKANDHSACGHGIFGEDGLICLLGGRESVGALEILHVLSDRGQRVRTRELRAEE